MRVGRAREVSAASSAGRARWSRHPSSRYPSCDPLGFDWGGGLVALRPILVARTAPGPGKNLNGSRPDTRLTFAPRGRVDCVTALREAASRPTPPGRKRSKGNQALPGSRRVFSARRTVTGARNGPSSTAHCSSMIVFASWMRPSRIHRERLVDAELEQLDVLALLDESRHGRAVRADAVVAAPRRSAGARSPSRGSCTRRTRARPRRSRRPVSSAASRRIAVAGSSSSSSPGGRLDQHPVGMVVDVDGVAELAGEQHRAPLGVVQEHRRAVAAVVRLALLASPTAPDGSRYSSVVRRSTCQAAASSSTSVTRTSGLRSQIAAGPIETGAATVIGDVDSGSWRSHGRERNRPRMIRRCLPRHAREPWPRHPARP